MTNKRKSRAKPFLPIVMGKKPTKRTLKSAIHERMNDRWRNQFAADTIDRKGYLSMLLSDIEFGEWGFNWPKDGEVVIDT